MREQLIQWLIDDIAPEVKRTKNAFGAILKFARENNLSPAQVEGLGQLFNTAKTLSFLEKSANRGGDFPILDVPKLVREFMEVEPAVKSARWAALPVTVEESDLSPQARLPDAFQGLTVPVRHEYSLEEINIPIVTQGDREIKTAKARQAVAKKEQEEVDQIIFDAREDQRKIAREIEVTFRQNPDLSFQAVEADAWALFGEEMRPINTKIASYLQSQHVTVTRALAPASDGLVRDSHQLLEKFARFRDLEKLAVAGASWAGSQPESPWTDINAQAQAVASSGQAPTTEAPPPHHETGNREGAANLKERKPGGKALGKSEGPSKSSPSKDQSGYFGAINQGIDKIVDPALQEYGSRLKGVLRSQNNTEQRSVDTNFRDVQQVAMLQDLLLHDDVLSEADPEHVMSMFNTIRQAAPGMAGDINVMRVALRTAIQHDGISPFDLKSLIETEGAGQKTELARKQMDANKYQGAPLPGGKPEMAGK